MSAALVITIKVSSPPGARVTPLAGGVLIETEERIGFVPYGDFLRVDVQ